VTRPFNPPRSTDRRAEPEPVDEQAKEPARAGPPVAPGSIRQRKPIITDHAIIDAAGDIAAASGVSRARAALASPDIQLTADELAREDRGT